MFSPMASSPSSPPSSPPSHRPVADSPLDLRLIRLPAPYLAAFDAFEEYLTSQAVDLAGRRALVQTLDDLATCLEEAWAAGRSVRDVVGDDPSAVADALLANRVEGRSASGRDRLARAIDAIEREPGGGRAAPGGRGALVAAPDGVHDHAEGITSLVVDLLDHREG